MYRQETIIIRVLRRLARATITELTRYCVWNQGSSEIGIIYLPINVPQISEFYGISCRHNQPPRYGKIKVINLR